MSTAPAASSASSTGPSATVLPGAASPGESPGEPGETIHAPARVLLVHGDADQRVPADQSRRYAQAAAAAGDDRCELIELGGVEHFALIDPRTEAWAMTAAHLETMR